MALLGGLPMSGTPRRPKRRRSSCVTITEESCPAAVPVPEPESALQRSSAAPAAGHASRTASSGAPAAAEPAKLVKLRRKLERAQVHLAGCDATKCK